MKCNLFHLGKLFYDIVILISIFQRGAQEAWPGRVLPCTGRVLQIDFDFQRRFQRFINVTLPDVNAQSELMLSRGLKKTNRKGSTHCPEEYYSHPWPGPEIFWVYFRAGLRASSNHYFLVMAPLIKNYICSHMLVLDKTCD